MCLGFNCKNNYFPVSLLTKLLLHNSEKDTKEECKHYCILVIDDKVELSKSSFNNEVDEVTYDRIVIFKKYVLLVNVTAYVCNAESNRWMWIDWNW